ncbi:MAG: 5'-methylthioadenosine/S-adenosylhomocysteine nucleosidase [Bacilli bacterium]
MNKHRSVLIVFAMDEEISAFFNSTTATKTGVGMLENIYMDCLGDTTIYGMKGGVGKVSMAYSLGAFLNNIKVDKVYNTGVAGSLTSRLKPLSTLIATKCAYHDVDLTQFKYKKGQMSMMPLYFTCDKAGIKKALALNDKDVVTGTILSGDSFITVDKIPSSFFEDFDSPLAVDMESAAVGQVCYMAKTPFQIIRTISDSANTDSNLSQYQTLLNQACMKAAYITRQIIESECK